jgi:hypothetical protein
MNESLAVVEPLVTVTAAEVGTMLPSNEEVWPTLAKFKKRLSQGSNAQDANLYAYLDSIYEIAKTDSFLPIGKIAKGVRQTVSRTKTDIALVCQALRDNGRNIVVEHDWSGLQQGVWHKAKPGNPILGVTFDPPKDAGIDLRKVVREGRANPLALAAAAGSDND